MSASQAIECQLDSRLDVKEQQESRKRRWQTTSFDRGFAKRGGAEMTVSAVCPAISPTEGGRGVTQVPKGDGSSESLVAGRDYDALSSRSSSPSLLSTSSSSAQDSAHSDSTLGISPFPASHGSPTRVGLVGSMADLPEKFAVMIRQETGSYSCEDYLSPEFQKAKLREAAADAARGGDLRSSAVPSPDSTANFYAEDGMRKDWREKMCEWSYQVIDHFGFDREIASVSFCYLDRYLSKRGAPCMRTFQLVAMASLFLACKLRPGINEQCTLGVTSLVNLSRGYFCAEQIAATELAILRELSWKVHPPTPACFVRHLVLLIPPGACKSSVRHEIEETSKFFTELSVLDYFFVPRRKSSVALAALLNAMEGVEECYLPIQSRQEVIHAIRRVAGLNPDDMEVQECREKLRALHIASSYQRQADGIAA